MPQLREFRPASVDHFCYYGPPELVGWLVAPCGQSRDSDTLERSNFVALVKAVREAEPEGRDEYRTLRFDHWLVGWTECVLVRPGSKCAEVAQEIADRLDDYPIVDEDTLSELEADEYCESWNDWGWKEFCGRLRDEFELQERTTMRLFDLPQDVLREFYESLRPSGEYCLHEGSGNSLYIEDAVEDCERGQLAKFLWANRHNKPV